MVYRINSPTEGSFLLSKKADIIPQSLKYINSLSTKSTTNRISIILYNLLFSLPNKALSESGFEVTEAIDIFRLVEFVSFFIILFYLYLN